MNPNQWPSNVVRLLVIVLMMLVATTASAEWKEKVLYSFQGGNDGAYPAGGVVSDKRGNLYSATEAGGPPSCAPIGNYCGTVYELTPPANQGDSWTKTQIYMFKGKGDNDGEVPTGGLTIDGAGNLYGVTGYGGTGDCVLVGVAAGCGTVYELSPPTQKGGKWTEAILYNFRGGTDGDFPWGDLVFDKEANLYGATQFGGGKGTTCNQYYGGNCGTVFKLSPSKKKGGAWKEEILHRFAGGTDGANPNGDLILDATGAVYGLTTAGGNKNCNYGSGQIGCGTAFKLEPPTKKDGSWGEQLLHRFDRTNSDGGNPMAGLLLDSKGNLYGTTVNGGPGPGGIAFRLAPSEKSGRWKEAILHGFNDRGDDGYDPECSLIFDQAGNLYGTTNVSEIGFGDVFRLKPSGRNGTWVASVLHSFSAIPDGLFPAANLIFDKQGNLYSTTQQGGTGACPGGCGTVFEASP